MDSPPLVDDERRVDALRHYHLFGTPPEGVFDELTCRAAAALDAPFAFLALVGRNRQWFKATVGLDLSDPRTHLPFAYHAVLQDEPLVVLDARKDPRFAGTSYVAGPPYLRSCLAVPLVTPDGCRIGCLAVLDRASRQPEDQSLARLQSLAEEAMQLIERRRREREDVMTAALQAAEASAPAGPLFMQSEVMQLLADPLAGTLHAANAAACRFFGATPEELRRADLDALLGGDAAARLRSHDAASSRFQFRHEYPTGETRELEAYVSPVSLEGQPLCHLILHDVTERSQTEEKLRSVLAHARCILWTAEVREHHDRYHWWQRVSDEAAAMQILPLAICPGQDYAQAWYEARHPDDRARMDQVGTEALRSGSPSYSQEFRCIDRHGRLHWLYEDVSLQKLGPDQWHAVGVCTDVTERKAAEQEHARRLREQAAREEAEAGRRRLEAADQAKNRFLATLSHELRGPLGSLQNAAELLKRLAGDEPRLVRLAEMIERQVRFQTRLLDDLLDVTRISRGKISLARERVDFAALVYQILEDRRDTFEAAGLTLGVSLPSTPVPVDGDPVRLAQIVGNLAQNAVKFTDPGGTVAISLATVPERKQAVLAVRDTGIGIAPEKIGGIFEAFMQVEESQERSRSGLGLGLSLVRGLALLHGGAVRAESAGPGQGAVFTVEIPLAD
jgi:PAS domain S-box-containing protein